MPYVPSVRMSLGRNAGVYSIQGQRNHMEDSYYADHTTGFYAVYDGHGGGRASSYLTSNFHVLLSRHDYQRQPKEALSDSFRELDEQWLALAAHNNWDDGSTAITVLIQNKTLYVANVGDSRAVLCSSGVALAMSQDHKPSRADEKARIEALGGRILHYGTWRVEGVLAVTRAIGDRRLKRYVSAVPDIQTRTLVDGDDWLILASDGVWDVLSNQAVVDITLRAGDAKKAAKEIAHAAYRSQSLDNITALVIDLRPYR